MLEVVTLGHIGQLLLRITVILEFPMTFTVLSLNEVRHSFIFRSPRLTKMLHVSTLDQIHIDSL